MLSNAANKWLGKESFPANLSIVLRFEAPKEYPQSSFASPPVDVHLADQPMALGISRKSKPNVRQKVQKPNPFRIQHTVLP
jgi:hypothetical protein